MFTSIDCLCSLQVKPNWFCQPIGYTGVLDALDLAEKIEMIDKFIYTETHNEFYMIYGKEISYFTVFKIKEQIAFGREVIDVIKNVGAVKAIDPTDNVDAMEVWVIYDDEPTCLYLFPYDSGIVQVGE